jgi:hypothetical protein
MSLYKLVKNPDGSINEEVIKKTDTNEFISITFENRFHDAYLKWLAEGNVPEEAE